MPLFDLDAEIETHFRTSIERLCACFPFDHEYRKQCSAVLRKVAGDYPDCVIALPPSGLRDAFRRVVRKLPCLTVAIEDRAENILARITFYDVDSKRIDRSLTDKEKRLYLREIKKDITCFRKSCAGQTFTSISLISTSKPPPSGSKTT